MKKTLGLAMAALGAALLGAAPAERMLCFHQDGRIFLEKYQEKCCAAPCPADDKAGCPDDQCRDLPLTLDDDETLDLPSADVLPAPLASPPPFVALAGALEVRGPRSRGPDPPLDFLRTVVLRL